MCLVPACKRRALRSIPRVEKVFQKLRRLHKWVAAIQRGLPEILEAVKFVAPDGSFATALPEGRHAPTLTPPTPRRVPQPRRAESAMVQCPGYPSSHGALSTVIPALADSRLSHRDERQQPRG